LALVWEIGIRSVNGVVSTILPPLLPFLINPKMTTFNPDDDSSAPTAYFMSYEWFNDVGLDITMIFIMMILSGILVEYFRPVDFFRELFHLRSNMRTAAEHSLFTFMPDKYPLQSRVANVIILGMICAIVGCFAPIVFFFFCFYLLAFMTVESSERFDNEYLRLTYVNPEVFKKLAVAIEFSYLVFIATSFLSLLRIFLEVDATKGSLILLVLLLCLFTLVFIVSCLFDCSFFNKNNVELRLLDRFC
jgi:hypothetical protein